MAENVGQWGFDEVVDTLGDLIHAVGPNGIPQGIPKKGEKFDVVKFILAAVGEYPNLQEAVEDFATFWKQLTDLFPSESKAVSAALRAKYPTPSPLQETLLYNIENLALTQEWIQNDIFANGRALLDRWGNQ